MCGIDDREAIIPVAPLDSFDDQRHSGDYMLVPLLTKTIDECLRDIFEEPPRTLNPVIDEVSPAKASRPQFNSPNAEGKGSSFKVKLFSSPGLLLKPRSSETVMERFVNCSFW